MTKKVNKSFLYNATQKELLALLRKPNTVLEIEDLSVEEATELLAIRLAGFSGEEPPVDELARHKRQKVEEALHLIDVSDLYIA